MNEVERAILKGKLVSVLDEFDEENPQANLASRITKELIADYIIHAIEEAEWT